MNSPPTLVLLVTNVWSWLFWFPEEPCEPPGPEWSPLGPPWCPMSSPGVA
jgi:hypothetical protein